MQTLKRHKLVSIIAVLLLLVGLPTALVISQKQQEDRSRASGSTTLYLQPNSSEAAPLQKNLGDTVSFDVMINPGTNLPSLVKLEIKYDATKLQPLTTNAFIPNTAAFPQTLEGPVVNNGAVLVSLSIGSDTTKAIQTATKIGTVSFKTIAPTTTATSVSFGTKSQVLSIAQTDQSTQNVLSTSTPGFVNIISATLTPGEEVPTQTPTATPTATLTPTEMPSITSSPTAQLSSTVVPTTQMTTLNFTVFMHGIGNSGDNVNPDEYDLSNKIPKHPTRPMQVFIYNNANQLVASGSTTLTYASSSGNFKGSIDLANITQGLHTIKIFSPDHLKRLVSGIQTLTPGGTHNIPATTLIAGDVNNDNTVNILDYNLIVGCYSDLLPPDSCNETNKLSSDLNDDGFVNQFDYNMFLREISVQPGN